MANLLPGQEGKKELSLGKSKVVFWVRFYKHILFFIFFISSDQTLKFVVLINYSTYGLNYLIAIVHVLIGFSDQKIKLSFYSYLQTIVLINSKF
jgi:hypothetical protein